MNAALMVLVDFDGDGQISIISEQCYNWITNDNRGDNNITAFSWRDTTCTPEIMRELELDELPVITNASWQDDRARYVKPLNDHGDVLTFTSISDAKEYAEQYGITFIGEYNGFLF